MTPSYLHLRSTEKFNTMCQIILWIIQVRSLFPQQVQYLRACRAHLLRLLRAFLRPAREFLQLQTETQGAYSKQNHHHQSTLQAVLAITFCLKKSELELHSNISSCE